MEIMQIDYFLADSTCGVIFPSSTCGVKKIGLLCRWKAECPDRVESTMEEEYAMLSAASHGRRKVRSR